MQRAYKYRFYPTTDQRSALARTFGCVRYAYNWGLAARKAHFEETGKGLGYGASSKAFTAHKKERVGSDGVHFLREPSCVPLQQALRHLDRAFSNFFAGRARYPTFKRKLGKQSAEYTRSGFKYQQGVLTIAKLGALKVRWSRHFVGSPSSVTLSRDPSGRYHLSLLVDEPEPVALKGGEEAVGIDLGLTHFATLSTGKTIDNPRPLRRAESKLKRAQQALSRKKKGSKNREKARRSVARLHAVVADQRKDFLHKLSTKLIRENQAIYLEDLCVKGMVRDRSLAKSINDAGWAEFRRMLEYKGEWCGRHVLAIDRFEPSTKKCSSCGRVRDSLALHVRDWTCDGCGSPHDRDINAAINILAAGRAATACGESVSQVVPS